MKKKNLKLSDLKVQSFITSLNEEGALTVRGGAPPASVTCPTYVGGGCAYSNLCIANATIGQTCPIPFTSANIPGC